MDTNKRPATCRACRKSLAPGEGIRWQDQVPAGAGSGKFLCSVCEDTWSTWRELEIITADELSRIRYYVATTLPGAPVRVVENGRMMLVDQRGFSQALLRDVIQDAGIASYAVARCLAYELEHREPPPGSWRELIDFADYVKRSVLYRLTSVVNVPILSAVTPAKA